MIEKKQKQKFFMVIFIMALTISGCRSVDGNKTVRKEAVSGIAVNAEMQRQYHAYTLEEGTEPVLGDILAGLKKAEKEGKTEKVSKYYNTWVYEDDTTGEYIASLMTKDKKQVGSFSYRASSGKEYISSTMSIAADSAWGLSGNCVLETGESLDFIPIEKAVEETQLFLNNIGFHDVGIYRYAAMDELAGGTEQGYYYMIFTLQADGIPCFTSSGWEYRRQDTVEKSAIAPAIECVYDKDGVYWVMSDYRVYTIQSDLGTVDTINYEKALEKATESMNYMQEASELDERAEYQWDSAGIEYLPYRNLEKNEYQLLPIWVFRGQKKRGDVVSESYILVDAQTGEILSESE